MTTREYKRQVRANALRDLAKVAWYLDRIWQRKCPPPAKDAPVAGVDIPIPTPEEFHRELMSMHVDDRELLLASSSLHEIIDDLHMILPNDQPRAAS